eukprot:3113481-Rhodomonas_salina.2
MTAIARYGYGRFFDDLYEVLWAYATVRPTIGYVQGMSYTAALFLLYMTPYKHTVGYVQGTSYTAALFLLYMTPYKYNRIVLLRFHSTCIADGRVRARHVVQPRAVPVLLDPVQSTSNAAAPLQYCKSVLQYCKVYCDVPHSHYFSANGFDFFGFPVSGEPVGPCTLPGQSTLPLRVPDRSSGISEVYHDLYASSAVGFYYWSLCNQTTNMLTCVH